MLLNTGLTVGDAGVILAHQTRALRDEKKLASCRVVYVNGYKRFQFTWEIGVKTLLQYGWNLSAGLDLIAGQWCFTNRPQIVVGFMSSSGF